MEIIVDGKGHIIDDEGYVNVEAKHFSLSKLRAGSTATVTATLTQITTTTAVVRDGTNTVQYKEKSGFEVPNVKPTGIVLSILKSVYGSPVKETVKTTQYTSSASGEGTYNFKQPYTDHKFVSGNRTFEVRTKGSVLFKKGHPNEMALKWSSKNYYISDARYSVAVITGSFEAEKSLLLRVIITSALALTAV